MGKVKKYFDTLKQDVVVVLQKPSLVLSIVVIGFFMVWFASEQVKAILRFLIHLDVVDEKQATKFTHKYFFFGLSLLGVLWVNLELINIAYHRLKTAYVFLQDYWSKLNNTFFVTNQDKPPIKRRYALRSQCRRDT